jgi:prefoldin subunit 5
MICTSYRELSRRFAELRDLGNEAINDLDAEIKTLDEEIKQLEQSANSVEALKIKANYITKELEIFDEEILKLAN